MMHRSLATILAALVAGTAGCSMGGLFEGSAAVDVREVGRNLYCNASSDAPQVVLLPDPQAVLDWQAARGVTLAGAESLAQAPYALVEMGMRPTGGYGLAVARAAVLRGKRITLTATFVSPPPGSISTQALSSPCVLVQLPRGRYALVEVTDQTGAVRASGGLPEPPVTPEPAAAAPAAPAPGTPAPAPAEPPGGPGT